MWERVATGVRDRPQQAGVVQRRRSARGGRGRIDYCRGRSEVRQPNPPAEAPVPPTDHELVRAALGGSERAFRALVERYQRGVLSLVVRIVGNREDAEDVAQETFVKAFTRLDTFDPAYKFSNWLFKIAHNSALDALRRRGSQPAPLELVGEGDEDPVAELADPRAAPPDEATARAEFHSHLETALGRLRPEYRSVIVLRHLEGRAYEDIAEILGLPLGTVKTYLFRARRELAELMEQHR
jgi:RNA polymerase sigma-70 factor (ECF subfamily)